MKRPRGVIGTCSAQVDRRTALSGRLARVLRVLYILAVTAALGGCAVYTNTSGSQAVPMNPGARLDLLIQEPDFRSAHLVPLVRSAWAGNEVYRSWFVLVDRVGDPASTLVLDIDFRGVTRDSQVTGTAKYGFSTIYSARAEVVFSLTDIRSGIIVASATGSSRSSANRPGGELDQRAVTGAVQSGLRRLMQIYAGGGA